MNFFSNPKVKRAVVAVIAGLLILSMVVSTFLSVI